MGCLSLSVAHVSRKHLSQNCRVRIAVPHVAFLSTLCIRYPKLPVCQSSPYKSPNLARTGLSHYLPSIPHPRIRRHDSLSRHLRARRLVHHVPRKLRLAKPQQVVVGVVLPVPHPDGQRAALEHDGRIPQGAGHVVPGPQDGRFEREDVALLGLLVTPPR